MKNIFNTKAIKTTLFTLLFGLIALVLLFGALKGEVGNPTPSHILNEYRDAGNAFENSPERSRYAQLMALADYGSLTLPLQIAKIVVPDLGYADGKFTSVYPPGFLFAVLPFYMVGAHFNMAQLVTFASSIVFILIDVWLFISICSALKIKRSAAIVAATLFLFATSSWAYTTVIYQYALELIFLLGIIRLAISKTTFLSAGLLWLMVAYAFIVDAPNIIFAVPVLFYYVFKDSGINKNTKRLTINVKKAVIYGFIFILPVVAFWGYYNYKTYGSPVKIAIQVAAIHGFDKNDNIIFAKKTDNFSGGSHVTFFNYDTLPRGISVLTVSRDRGLIFYSPFAILSLLGISILYKKNKNVTKMLVAAGLAIFTIYAAWGDPWGGWAFGPRYLIPFFAVFFVFLAQAIDTYKKNWIFISLLVILGVYSIFINTLGALTTNQIPPIREALGLHMKYNFFLNWDYLNGGLLSSFTYRTWLSHILTPMQYFLAMFSLATALFLSVFGIHILSKDKN